MSAAFKIGILECDRLSEDLRARHGSYSEMFQKLLSAATDEPLTFQTYQMLEADYPVKPKECDAYLITGSKYSVYDAQSWIKRLQNYVATLDAHSIKLIGICFGHQIVAQALGGDVYKHPGGWGVGVATSSLLQRKAWMDPPKDSFQLIASHQDQVRRLPAGAELLSSSAFCVNGSYQLGEHILCFQGHPEFTPAYARERLQARQGVIDEETVKKGLDSLQQKTDASLIARWITKFLLR
jgi:GMP synthase-like glutamine amidotransferase